MKKTLSFGLALVMIFALAMSAFATPVNSGGATLDVAGEAVGPTITMTMPTGVVLGLNPYKMKYAGSTAFLKNEKGKQDQIISPLAIIENKSDVKLRVEATATAKPSTNVVLVATDDAVTVSSGTQPKNVHLQMQLGKVDSKTATAFPTASTPAAATFETSGKTVKYSSTYTADTAASGTMKPVEIEATDGKVANYFAFKFSGKAAEAPGTPWDDTDKIDVSVVFTFTPIVLSVAS